MSNGLIYAETDFFLKKGQPKNHYVVSSIWPGMKQCFQQVLDHSTWSVGTGKAIHFWTDKWLESSIVELWGIPPTLYSSLNMMVSYCIEEGSWCLPHFIIHKDVALATQICNFTLPSANIHNKLCWTSASDGELTSKISYKHITGSGPHVLWDKLLWNSCIPPTRSFITWRMLHNKLPTDENLRKRGCNIVSVCCSICKLLNPLNISS